jgi:hypothetical protein
MKREIIINYGKIERAINNLGSYLGSLNRIEAVIDKNSEFLSDQRGAAFDALEVKRMKIKGCIAEQREMANDFRNSLINYMRDMEDRIHPVSRHQDVRVRRDDIGINLMQTKDKVNDVFSPKIWLVDETDPYFEIWVSAGDKGGGHYEQNWDKIDAEKRNGAKIDDFQDYFLPRIKIRIDESLCRIEDIHRNNVQEFENTDDRHARYAKELYDKYTDDGERAFDREQKFQRWAKDFGLGALEGIKSTVLGLWGLIKVGGAYAITGLATILTLEPPDWAKVEIDDFKSGFAGLKSPLEFFKRIGQNFCDTYEEKGLAYVAGGVTFEVVSTTVPVSKITTVLKTLNKIDNVTDVTRVVDELSDAARGINKVDDIVTDAPKGLSKVVDPADSVKKLKIVDGFPNLVKLARLTVDDQIEIINRLRQFENLTNDEIMVIIKAIDEGDYRKMASYLNLKSPKDRAVFWSNDVKAAKEFAEQIDGVTLEMTPGGKVFDDWAWLKEKFPEWDTGTPLDAKPIWKALSEEYARNASGKITYVNAKAFDGKPPGWMWSNVEKKILEILKEIGIVDEIHYVPSLP